MSNPYEILFHELGINEGGIGTAYLFSSFPYRTAFDEIKMGTFSKVVQLQYPFVLALLTTKKG